MYNESKKVAPIGKEKIPVRKKYYPYIGYDYKKFNNINSDTENITIKKKIMKLNRLAKN